MSPSLTHTPLQVSHYTSHLNIQLAKMTISPNTVTTELVYFEPPPDGSKPYIMINADPATGKRGQNWIRVPHQVQIENIRGKEDTASLDTTGFQYFRRPQKYTSFTDDDEIEREYYPESAELIKEITGASKVVLFDHSKVYSLVKVTAAF